MKFNSILAILYDFNVFIGSFFASAESFTTR